MSGPPPRGAPLNLNSGFRFFAYLWGGILVVSKICCEDIDLLFTCCSQEGTLPASLALIIYSVLLASSVGWDFRLRWRQRV